ncbi:MAG: hypothetical protein FWE31_05075 [Firmicutes bacterium]|nr:hypothetical protein [Bacillota bacterium]
MKKLKGLVVAFAVMALVIPVAFVATACGRNNNPPAASTRPADGIYVVTTQGQAWLEEILDIFLAIIVDGEGGDIGIIARPNPEQRVREDLKWHYESVRDRQNNWSPTYLDALQDFWSDHGPNWNYHVFPGVYDFIMGLTDPIDDIEYFFQVTLFEVVMANMGNQPQPENPGDDIDTVINTVLGVWFAMFEEMTVRIAGYTMFLEINFEDIFAAILEDEDLDQEDIEEIEAILEIIKDAFDGAVISIGMPYTMVGDRMNFNTGTISTSIAEILEIISDIAYEIDGEELEGLEEILDELEAGLAMMFQFIRFQVGTNNTITIAANLTNDMLETMMDMVLGFLTEEELEDFPFDLEEFNMGFIAGMIMMARPTLGSEFPILNRIQIEGPAAAPTGISLNITQLQRAA